MNNGRFAAFEKLGVQHSGANNLDVLDGEFVEFNGDDDRQYQPEASVLYAEQLQRDLGECRWFARCGRPATGTTPHPVLGDVPTCDRCAAFAGGR